MQPGMRPEETARAAIGHEDVRCDAVLTELKQQLGERQFALWCDGKIRPSLTDDQLTIAVGSPFLLSWFQKQFREAVTVVAHSVIGPHAHAVFVVDASLALKPVNPAERAPTVVAVEPRQPAPALQKTVAPRQRRLAELSEFVAGPNTALAATAAQQVADQPGAGCNPLYFHGSVGVGKTHLLEGICRQLKRTHPSLQTMLLTAESFANYFTQALTERTLPSFRQRFRGLDVLLVDDIDFFEGKRVFQEEFLHTLGDLVDHGRQVVVTGDRHPKLLTKLGDELVSRLISGMVCRLEPPAIEIRRKIVAIKARRLSGEFAPEALQHIAEQFSGSVRELEGALNCLQTYYTMTGKRITLAAARQVLSELERDCLRMVRLADVERVVCQLFGLKPKDLKSDSRVRTLAQPRMLAMFLARKHTQSAYSEIGQHFGGRNHSTVMSAERQVQKWLHENATVRVASQSWAISEIVATLEQQLLAG